MSTFTPRADDPSIDETASVAAGPPDRSLRRDAIGTIILGFVALVCLGLIGTLALVDRAIPDVLEMLAATAVGGVALAAPPQLSRRS